MGLKGASQGTSLGCRARSSLFAAILSPSFGAILRAHFYLVCFSLSSSSAGWEGRVPHQPAWLAAHICMLTAGGGFGSGLCFVNELHKLQVLPRKAVGCFFLFCFVLLLFVFSFSLKNKASLIPCFPENNTLSPVTVGATRRGSTTTLSPCG